MTKKNISAKEQQNDRVDALRAALIEGEQSGISDLNMDQVWAKARMRLRKGT